MNYIWIIIAVAYIFLSHYVAKNVGEKRQIGYGKTILWSVLLSPFIAYFIAKNSSPIEKA